MATFLMLGKYSPNALKKISPDRTAKAINLVKKLGGKFHSMHALLGDYDLVFLLELPGITQAMEASLALNKLTEISFTTYPAVEIKAFDRLTPA
ncbi:MAG TPA: GYD domain-containing protein [Cyclobacteriaceae bacterium]|nr:GYD domain-containing protein [Cyclobacteriaceae bacterium]